MARGWYSVLVRENLYGIGSQFVSIAFGIVFGIVFPRILGPTSFSYFSLVFAVSNFFLFFCDLGLSTALLKMMPAGLVRKEALSHYRLFSALKYVLTVVSSVLLFVLSDFIALRFFRLPELGFGMKVGSLFLFSYSLHGFYETLFVVVKKTKFSFYVNAVFQASRIVFPLFLFYLYRTYTSVLMGLGLAALVGMVSGLLLKRSLGFLREGVGLVDYKTLKSYSFYGALLYLGTLAVQWLDSIVVGVFVSPVEVGVYRIGVMWMGVVWLFIPFSSSVLTALYSEKTETREKDRINTVYSYSLRYSLTITFLIMTGIWLTSDYAIELVYGQSYAAAAPILLILSPLALESALYAINNPLLKGVGRVNVQAFYMVAVGVLTVLGSILASPYGIRGVAVAVTVIRVASIIVLTLYVIRHLKARLDYNACLRPALSGLLTFLILTPFKPAVVSPVYGLLYGLVVVLVYSITAVLLKAVSLHEIKKVMLALRG